MNPVVIIIPVYNAPEQVERCLSSVFKNTELSDDCSLLIINDKSSDFRIENLLGAIAKQFVTIINHKENLGYTRTINEGISLNVGRDIVLLNSDTQVTPCWLEKLRKAAYSSDRVGTVTPVSNNAGAFSVPEKDYNKIPSDVSLDEMAHIVEKCGQEQMFRVPTGNGFCFYIKSNVLQHVGLFDDINFPRGYGEENDFCMRVLHAGFENIVTLDTYIYHEGHASFSHARNALQAQGLENLAVLYPDYFSLIKVFDENEVFNSVKRAIRRKVLFRSPNYAISLLIKKVSFYFSWLSKSSRVIGRIGHKIRSKKMSFAVCFEKFFTAFNQGGLRGVIRKMNTEGVCASSIDYCDLDRDDVRKFLGKAFSPDAKAVCIIDHRYGGGANVYSLKYIKSITCNGQNVLHVTWDMHACCVIMIAYTGCRRVVLRTNNFEDIVHSEWLFFSKIILNEIVYWSIADKGKLQNSYASVPLLLAEIEDLVAKNGAELEVPMHDYFCLCPSATLLNNKEEFCCVPDEERICQECLAQQKEMLLPDGFSLQLWREAWQRCLNKASSVLFFSRSSFEICQKVFHFRDNTHIVPHEPVENWKHTYVMPTCSTMTIAVIGAIGPHKGSKIVYNMLPLLGKGERIVVIGDFFIGRPIQCSEKLLIHGKYEHSDLPRLLEQYQVTVGFIPSIWPETFSYTTQECMLLGLPTVAFAIGAQGERIGTWEHGLLAEDISAESAYKALRELDSRRYADSAK